MIMVVAAKKFLFACVLILYANSIYSSPKTKFSFKKTFLTPRELYEKRNEELDKCEILERSNFSSDEDDDKKDPVVKPKDDVHKVVANAHIHVRFGGEPDPPTARNEKFIEISDRIPKKQKRFPNQDVNETPENIPTNQEWFYQPHQAEKGCCNQFMPYLPPTCHQYPPVFPPYNPYYNFGPNGFPYGHMYGSYYSHLTPMGYPPQYNPYHNFAQCASHIDNQPCPCTTSKPTMKPQSNVTEVPFVYFFKRDKCGQVPSPEEIKNQPTEELTDEHLRLIKKFLDIGESWEGKNAEKKKRLVDWGSSTPVSEPTTQSTIISLGTTTDLPCNSDEPITSKMPAQGPTTCSPKPAPCSCNGDFLEDVVLTNVIQPARCKDRNPRDCLILSENLKFVKVNLSELTNSSCNCSRTRHGSIHDIDDLVRFKGNLIYDSSPYQQTYPFLPYGDPRYINFYPWMGMYGNPWRCQKGFSSVPDPQLYGYFKPAQPPFLPPNGFYNT